MIDLMIPVMGNVPMFRTSTDALLYVCVVGLLLRLCLGTFRCVER